MLAVIGHRVWMEWRKRCKIIRPFTRSEYYRNA